MTTVDTMTERHNETADPAVGRRAKQSPADIMLGAWEVFDTVGYDTATMTDIATAAGISRRTLFNHFPSKVSLLFPVADAFMTGLTERLNTRPADERLVVSIAECVIEMADESTKLAEQHSPGPEILKARMSDEAIKYSRELWAHKMEAAALTRLGDAPGASIKAAFVGAVAAQFLTEILHLMRNTGKTHSEALREVMDNLRDLLQ